MTHSLEFTAVSEDRPGAKWLARWTRSWPAYEAWFRGRGGDAGPSRAACEAALSRYMPELVGIHGSLTRLTGNGDRAARFLSGWCPPPYLGGCTLAAQSHDGEVRLVRNYDLSPDLNEGLLLRSAWKRPVMGMVEFIWGLSDGINDTGLCIALAYGGRGTVGRGFGITTIVRYLLETSDSVAEALQRLERVPSHMAYNLVLADAAGNTASVELLPGGGLRRLARPVATNHQSGPEPADRPAFTRTVERRAAVEEIITHNSRPADLHKRFMSAPLYQSDYANGFGTLFTADYDPVGRGLVLRWPTETWVQSLSSFHEGSRRITYESRTQADAFPAMPGEDRSIWTPPTSDWVAWGLDIAHRYTPESALDSWRAACAAPRCRAAT